VWAAERRSRTRKHYRFDDVAITPRPCSGRSLLCRLVLAASIELADGSLQSDRRAVRRAMTFGGLRQVRDLYDETCARTGIGAGPHVQLFPAFRRLAEEEAAARPVRSAITANARRGLSR